MQQVSECELMLTIFVHASFLTFGKSARSALITMRLVDNASSFFFSFTHILSVSSNGSFEETSTAVTGEYTVMFS